MLGLVTCATLASSTLASTEGVAKLEEDHIKDDTSLLQLPVTAVIPPQTPVHVQTQPTTSWGSEAEVASSLELERARKTTTEVCLSVQDLPRIMSQTIDEVLQGLPPWTQPAVPAEVQDPRLAFLVQVSFESKLPLLRRTFNHLYNTKDTFLYVVDKARLHPSSVKAALPSPLPPNVMVKSSFHAGYFYWPRVQVLLNSLHTLLKQKWDFVVHLSESDYPLHTVNWIHEFLSPQRQRSFIKLTPRCSQADQEDVVVDQWYWWSQRNAVASCGNARPAEPVDGVHFPIEFLEEQGLTFARAPEWFVLTREMVQYATSPKLASFRRLIAMHAASDEIFWSTLVLNIPGFTQDIGQQNWFEFWQRGTSTHSPVTLTADHEEAILANRHQQLFMRKVSMVDSSTLLADIDSLLAEPETPFISMTQAAKEQQVDWRRHAIACPAYQSIETFNDSNVTFNDSNETFNDSNETLNESNVSSNVKPEITIKPKIIIIKMAADPTQCISAAGGRFSNGTNVQIWECGPGDAFEFIMPESGTGLIRMAADPRYCISTAGGRFSNGNNVQIWACTPGDDAFKFIVPESGTGFIQMAADPTTCISSRGGSSSNGNNVQLWDCEDGAAFEFFVDEPIDDPIDDSIDEPIDDRAVERTIGPIDDRAVEKARLG